jgi:hypothetical protein
VPKSVGSFLAVDQNFLNEFKLIELVLMANFKGGTPKYRIRTYRVPICWWRFYRIAHIIECLKDRTPLRSNGLKHRIP